MAVGIFKISNFRKTYYYLKKNGWKNAFYAALERVADRRDADYCYEEPKKDVLDGQRKAECPYQFSVLVPAYETDAGYLREMINSVLGQSYGNLELILADASKTGKVQEVVEGYEDRRLRYIRLMENRGISENTNAALAAAAGDYVGLLDHDDVLSPDALFEMAKAIDEGKKKGKTVWMLYSDEDKADGDMAKFYEPHRKPGLNLDLLFSNNYICHFLVMKRELMQELGFRQKFDGAQDYDLTLRAVGKLIYEEKRGRDAVAHIPKTLYHWRCHTASTAENPESKRYAYEAGKMALEDFLEKRGWEGEVHHTLHLGFYRIQYKKDIFMQREEAGVIGGKLVDRRGRIVGGIYNARGKCPYFGLNRNFSGYMHRAGLNQEAYAVDLRCMRVRKELRGIFEDVFGIPYEETPGKGGGWFPYEKSNSYFPRGLAGRKGIKGNVGRQMQQQKERELRRQCMEFGERVRKAGYTVIWTPGWEMFV